MQNWDVRLTPGSTLGIVGPVGSGKSTFLKLLQLLESPPTGAIFLDGQDITEFSPSSVRKKFAYVSQEPFLFSDTVRNNLLMSRPQADEEELAQAVERAALTEDLADFPEGLDTLLGERGISLSGGQKQRTALARAFLKTAPFVLLDDTLSAVDTVTEGRILSYLQTKQQNPKPCIVIVSHRLSAMAQADEILVVDEGVIVDRGTHQNLSSRDGIYRDLLAHQSEGEVEPLV